MRRVKFVRGLAALSVCVLAVPAASQVAPPPLDAYGELPAVEDINISAGGKLATLALSGGKRVIAILDAAMQPIRAIEVGDMKIRAIRWIGDDAIMVERSETAKFDGRFYADQAELFNALIIPANEAGEIHTVFADDRQMVKAVFGTHGFRRVNGKWVGLFSGMPMKGERAGGEYYYNGGNPALYAVDLNSNKARQVASAPNSDETADWLIDPSGVVGATLLFNHTSDGWRLVNAKGRQVASGNQPKGSASLSAFDATGTKAIYAVTPEHGVAQFYQVALDGSGAPEQLWADKEVEAVYLDPDTSRMIGYRLDVGADGTPVFVDAATEAKVTKALSAFPGSQLRDYSKDFNRILIGTAGNNDSGTWYLFDAAQTRSYRIGRARPAIAPDQVGPISTIHYKAQDGLEIEAVLTLPPGKAAKGLPLVMLPHGGPRASDDATFDWWAQAFASRGYAVLQPNFRGSTDYGDTFLHAGDGQWGRKMQTDLSDGMAWLAEQGTIDPTRACIVGASYGGYAALAGVTLQQGKYRCAVAVAGVSDLELFFNREYRESGDSADLREGWLEMMGPRNQLSQVSPRTFASAANAPVMLIHGRDDTVVPFEQSQRMADALKDAGKPYEFVELQGEDHWLSRSATRKRMLQSAVAFVQKNNPAN